ncbi:hypothetical protein V6Z11_D08G086400 [Gossypium hirsutum]|uniref:Uncharacterized protein isoform X2 n=1 Tax=Gossypium hirsutum TaxID=3635 RepID=A0A1U8KAT1_GOSHI|nr:uncharacterized protein LOC107913597 isoform X2 [Gossypium hirsutum]
MGLFHYNPILCLSMESGHFYSVSFSLTLPFSHVKKSSHSARSQSRPLLLPSSLASNSPPQVCGGGVLRSSSRPCNFSSKASLWCLSLLASLV